MYSALQLLMVEEEVEEEVGAQCSETVPSLLPPSPLQQQPALPTLLWNSARNSTLKYFTSLQCTPTSVLCCTGLQPPVCNAGTLMWSSTRECGSECKWWASPWSPPTTAAPWSTVVAASWSSAWSHGSPSTGHWSQAWQKLTLSACTEKQFAR